MVQNTKHKKVNIVFLLLALTLIVLAPFQGIILMWLTSIFGHQIIWQIWKEILLIILVILATFYIYKDRELYSLMKKDKLFWAIGIYATLHIVLVATKALDIRSALAGTMLNLRFLGFFIVAFVLGYMMKDKILHRIPKLVLLIGFIVAGFAVLQMTILPLDFLSHVGYNGKPIPAHFTIDSDMGSVRVASTTRGPNNLGAFLIVPLLLFLFHFARAIKLWLGDRNVSNFKTMILLGTGTLVSITALYGTCSRSAWLGFIIAMILLVFFSLKSKYRTIITVLGIIAVFVITGLGFAFRDTAFFHTVFLHDVPGVGGVATSNEGHIGAMRTGLKSISDEKFVGCGPGCAGPASLHNPNGAQIAENYFIQITQETGVFGLVLFIWLSSTITFRLFDHRDKDSLAIVLVSSFVGVSVICLFLHTWADDSIAYVWWGLAGLLIGSYSHLDSETASAKHLRTSA